MSAEDLIPFLRKIELFTDLSDSEMNSLLPFLRTEIFEKGAWIIKEGETGQQLFLIKGGRAEIVKEEKEFNYFHQLGTLDPGDWVGEMAHFEKEKRSASIRSLERVEVIVLSLDQLATAPDKQVLYSKIMTHLAKRVSQRLRKASESLIDSLKEKLRILQTYNQVSQTIIHIFIVIAIWFNFSKLVEMFPFENPYLDSIFNAGAVLLFGGSTIYVIKISGYPLSFYGITLKRWRRNIFDAILFTIPILVFLILLKWVLVSRVEIFKGISVFSINQPHMTGKQLALFAALYVFLVPLQELVARGFLQSCFRNFFRGPDRVFFAILTSNLLFEVVHTVKSFWLAIGTFFIGIFWGILFEQQKSLVGVCVSHAIVGAFVFFVLDFPTIFSLASK